MSEQPIIINKEEESDFLLTWWVWGQKKGKYLPDKESLIDAYENGVLHNVNGNQAWIKGQLFLNHTIHGWTNCEECIRIKKKHGWDIK